MNRVLLLAAAVAATALSAPSPAADRTKEPPACAAVSFRPLTGHLSDGESRAGHYRSRFGSIDLMGTVKGGEPADYRVVINGKALTPLSGEIPKSSYSCLNSKHVKTPPEPVSGACLGDRYRVAIDSSGKEKLVMLFALKGDEWKLCQAGTPPH